MKEIFDKLFQELSNAAAKNSTELAEKAIHSARLSKCAAEDNKFLEFDSASELIEGDERLFIQYRWYDTSKTFSVRPDMNVYLLSSIDLG